MSKYFFSEPNQSPWIVDFYNKHLSYKTDGFVVEIGVGHTIKGIDKNLENISEHHQRCGSNTADLIDLGWSGIFIEPVKEYCDEFKITHRNNIERLKIENLGAGNEKTSLKLFLGDSFIPNQAGQNGYSWVGREINIEPTSVILEKNNSPKNIDIMSIDVEGFELEVLKGIDFNLHTPHILIIETDKISVNDVNKIIPKEYKYEYSDNVNSLWVYKK
jgi:FkbM family methyltransferase